LSAILRSCGLKLRMPTFADYNASSNGAIKL
jgi:hypothetical protein